jgi:hypothetical protein
MRMIDCGPRGIITMEKWWFSPWPREKYYARIVKKMKHRKRKGK